MRSDYALYTVAVIFFILTGIVYLYQTEYRELWIVATAAAGLFFIGIGYTQRPKVKTKATAIGAPSPAPPATATQIIQAEAPKETAPATRELTEVKGIGAKRAERLKAIGITSIEGLARASANDLASKLKVSPKITKRWIENAKKLVEKS